MLRDLLRMRECHHDRILMLLMAAKSVRSHYPKGRSLLIAEGPDQNWKGRGFMTLGRDGRRSRMGGLQQQQFMVSALNRSVGEWVD